MRSPSWRLPALACAALLLGSCFEPPVEESVQLRFLPNGAVVVSSTVAVNGQDDDENPALTRRLTELRQALLDGSDAWSRRFARIEPTLERSSWEKQLGAVRKGVHAGVLAEPGQLERLFSDTALNVSYEVREDGVAELLLAPGAPAQATARQRQLVAKTLETWTGSVARYLAQAHDLYQYLDANPGRARACLGSLLEDSLAKTEKEKLPEVTDAEKARLQHLQDAMAEVWAVLAPAPREAYTADELSHLVYDPLPGRLTVRLPAAPLETPEGFVAGPDGALTAEGPGLWQALRALEGRWLSPDPLLLYIAHQASQTDLDLNTLLRQPRRASAPPDATEVRQAIEERLRPAPVYRVMWKIAPGAEEVPFRWEPGEG
jgi:hypothetical protein